MLSGCNIVQPPRNHQYYVQIFVKLSHALSSGKKYKIKHEYYGNTGCGVFKRGIQN